MDPCSHQIWYGSLLAPPENCSPDKIASDIKPEKFAADCLILLKFGNGMHGGRESVKTNFQSNPKMADGAQIRNLRYLWHFLPFQ